MAIADNRFDLSKIADVARSNFDKSSDTSMKNESTSLASKQNSSNSVTTSNPVEKKSADNIVSVFEDKVCDSTPLDIKLPEFQNGMFRGLNIPGSNMPDFSFCGEKVNPFDNILTHPDQLAYKTSGAINDPINRANHLMDMARNNSRDALRTIGLSDKTADCLLSGLDGALKNFKGPLANRQDLSIGDGCFGSALTDLLSNPLALTAGIIATGLMINSFMSKDEGVAAQYIDATLTSEEPGSRTKVIGGMKSTLIDPNGTKTSNKLTMLSAIQNSQDDPVLKNTESIGYRADGGRILDNMSNDKGSKSPTNDYNNLNNNMSTVDPNWNIDENRNYNLSKTKDNPSVTSMCVNKVNSTRPLNNTRDGKSTTDLDNASKVAVLNSTISPKEERDMLSKINNENNTAANGSNNAYNQQLAISNTNSLEDSLDASTSTTGANTTVSGTNTITTSADGGSVVIGSLVVAGAVASNKASGSRKRVGDNIGNNDSVMLSSGKVVKKSLIKAGNYNTGIDNGSGVNPVLLAMQNDNSGITSGVGNKGVSGVVSSNKKQNLIAKLASSGSMNNVSKANTYNGLQEINKTQLGTTQLCL
jgi:hypothetical protein